MLEIPFLHIEILKAVSHKPDQVNGTLRNLKAISSVARGGGGARAPPIGL